MFEVQLFKHNERILSQADQTQSCTWVIHHMSHMIWCVPDLLQHSMSLRLCFKILWNEQEK